MADGPIATTYFVIHARGIDWSLSPDSMTVRVDVLPALVSCDEAWFRAVLLCDMSAAESCSRWLELTTLIIEETMHLSTILCSLQLG
jgi:hypothetical protein